MALQEAESALAEEEFPVGCVIVDSEGVLCSSRRKNSRKNNEIDHAEILALRKLYEKYPAEKPADLVVYSTMEPCLMCFSSLILNNIHTIVFGYEDVMGGGTSLRLTDMKPLYSDKKVKVIANVLRDESVQLFKRFFANDVHGYWRNSLLAQYTLKQ